MSTSAAYYTGAGMTPIKIPPGLVGSGENEAALGLETQGLTPDAALQAQEELQRLQLENEERKKKALRAIFGVDFPLAKDEAETTEYDWSRWADNRWEKFRSGVSQ